MKLTTLVLAVALCVLLGSIVLFSTKPHSATALSTAPPPEMTGAPGEGTCASCHTGTSGTGFVTAVLIDSPTSYVPGRTDTLSILVSAPAGAFRWGFEVTALKGDQNMAGSLTPLAVFTPQTGVATSGGKMYAGHRSNGAIAPDDPDDGTYWTTFYLLTAAGWRVEWTAPSAGAGPVTFYIAAISANGDGASGNTDTTYTTSYTIPEQPSSATTQTTWGKIKKQYR